MREIKLKAWNKKLNIFYSIVESLSILLDIKKTPDYWENYKDIVFMQYTGLRDKNGKEIYEGDILEIPDDYDKFGFMALEKREVYFLDGCFRLKPLKKNKGRGHTIEDDMNMCKVIGNIYENPDILEINK